MEHDYPGNGGISRNPSPSYLPVIKRGLPIEAPVIKPVTGECAPVMLSLGNNHLSVQLVEITPDLAAEWLATTDEERQRTIKPTNLGKIKRSLQQNEWRVNGESIKFKPNGELGDGRHRLQACVETGIPLISLVVRGVKAKAIRTVDDGVVRNIKDRIQIQGEYKPGKGMSYGSALKMLSEYDGREYLPRSNIVLANFEVENLLAKHPDLTDSLDFGAAAQKGSFLPPGIGTLLHYLFRQKNRVQADDFFDKLATGENVSGPILVFRNRLLRMPRKIRQASDSRWELTALAVKAWNAYRLGKEIQTLRYVKGESFPIIV